MKERKEKLCGWLDTLSAGIGKMSQLMPKSVYPNMALGNSRAAGCCIKFNKLLRFILPGQSKELETDLVDANKTYHIQRIRRIQGNYCRCMRWILTQMTENRQRCRISHEKRERKNTAGSARISLCSYINQANNLP